MKKTTPFFCALIATAIAMPLLHAEEGICHRCEVIREHNKNHPNNYEYYEDYLKEQGKGPAQTSDSATKNEKAAKKNSGNTHNNSKSNSKNNNNNNNNNSNNNNSNSNNSQNTHGNG